MDRRTLLRKGTIMGQNYKMVRRIGSGSFGDIWEATHISSGEVVAIKMERIRVRFATSQACL